MTAAENPRSVNAGADISSVGDRLSVGVSVGDWLSVGVSVGDWLSVGVSVGDGEVVFVGVSEGLVFEEQPATPPRSAIPTLRRSFRLGIISTTVVMFRRSHKYFL
jgi:hypothetical protein